MKNQFFLFLTIAILAMATSCQKEHLETAGADVPTVGELKAGPTTVSPNAYKGWDIWNICGADFYASVQYNGTALPTLYIMGNGNGVLPSMALNTLQPNLVPPAVKGALYSINPNEQPMALWQSFNPDNNTVIAEYATSSGMVEVYLIDLSGKLICKGYHY